MKILFIWPNKDQYGFRPIGISLLSALLKREGHKTSLFDTTFVDFGYVDNTSYKEELGVFDKVNTDGYDLQKNLNLESELYKKLNDFKPDIVGISSLSDEVNIGLKISELIKKHNNSIVTLWGNKLCTMNPNTIQSKYIDYGCRGEAIVFMKEFVDAIESGRDVRNIKNLIYKENNKIILNELNPLYMDLDSLPYLDWTIFDKRHFLKPYKGKLETGGDHMITWGCPNICTYCINKSYRSLYKENSVYIRSYTIDRIIEELKYLTNKYKISFYKFHDEDFCLKSKSYLEQLSKRYQDEINVPFTIMVNAMRVNEDKVKLLKQMNCVTVSIGVETGNDYLRKNILKRLETKDQIINASKLFKKYNIRTSSYNMFGIPLETRDTIMETVKLNKEAEIDCPNSVFFFPLEGTELREYSIEKGYFEKDSNKIFKHDEPSLDLDTISKEDLIKLRERFLLYVKLPEEYYDRIRESEHNDKLMKELIKLYKDNYK